MIGTSVMKELRNKFNLLTEQEKGDVDMLVIFEKELENSFPSAQCPIPWYISRFGSTKANSVEESWFL